MKINSLKKRVSIGLPVYNGEKYIRQAIESVLNQDYFNFDLIISDNASTDATQSICEEYLSKDSRIKYYRNDKNLGAIENSLIVLNKADTEFFVFLSHDDYFENSFLSKCIDKLDNNLSAISCCSELNFIDINGNVINTPDALINSKGLDTSGLGVVARFKLLWSRAIWTATHAVYRTYFLKEVSPIQFKYGCDAILLTGAVLSGHIIRVEEKLFNYRVLKKSTEEYKELFFGTQSNLVSDKPITELFLTIVEQIYTLVKDTKEREALIEALIDFLISQEKNLTVILKENEYSINKSFIKGLIMNDLLKKELKKYEKEYLVKNSRKLNLEKEAYFLNLYKEKKYTNLILDLESIKNEYYMSPEMRNISSITYFHNKNIEKSLYIIKDLNEEFPNNNLFANNLAIINFYLLNINKSLSIFKNILENEYLDIYIENYLKIVSFLGLKDTLQIETSQYTNSDKYILEMIFKQHQFYQNKKGNYSLSIVLIFINDINLIKEQLKNIQNHKTKYNIEIIIVYNEKYNIRNIFENNIRLISFSEEKNENEFTAINKALEKSYGKYSTIMVPTQTYFEGSLDKIISFFDSQPENTMLVYTKVYNKIGTALDDVDISKFQKLINIENIPYLGCSIFWKKDVHYYSGYLKDTVFGIDALTEHSLFEFVIRVSQTYNIVFYETVSGMFVLEVDKTRFYLKEAAHFIAKYNEANLKNKLLYFKNQIPELDFYTSYESNQYQNKREFKYYIFYDNIIDFSKIEKLPNYYIILFQKTIDLSLSEKEVFLINKNFDQIWVMNESDKSFYVELGIDKYRIEIVSFSYEINSYNIEKFKEFISNLEIRPILRENFQKIKNENVNLAYQNFNNSLYDKAEEYFYKLYKLDLNNGEYIFHLGVCNFYQNKYDEAINFFSECLDLSFYNKDLFELMSKSLEKIGHYDIAKEYYKKFLE